MKERKKQSNKQTIKQGIKQTNNNGINECMNEWKWRRNKDIRIWIDLLANTANLKP